MRKYLIIKACFVLGLAIGLPAYAQCGPGGCATSSYGFQSGYSGQFLVPGSFQGYQRTSVFQVPSWQTPGWQSGTQLLFPPVPSWGGYHSPGNIDYRSRTRIRYR